MAIISILSAVFSNKTDHGSVLRDAKSYYDKADMLLGQAEETMKRASEINLDAQQSLQEATELHSKSQELCK